MTALHLAVWHRHPEAVKVLLQAKVRGGGGVHILLPW